MKKYLLSKYSDNCCYIQSKFNAFVFGIFIALFIIYFLLFQQNPIKPTIIFLNNNSSYKTKISYINLIPIHEKLIPDFLTKIIDKPQKPATCFIMIRTADGGIG